MEIYQVENVIHLNILSFNHKSALIKSIYKFKTQLSKLFKPFSNTYFPFPILLNNNLFFILIVIQIPNTIQCRL